MPGIAYIIIKKNKIRRLALFGIKNYYKPTIIKTGWHWHEMGKLDLQIGEGSKEIPVLMNIVSSTDIRAMESF